MNKTERLNLLKNSKPEYVIYWHHLKEHKNPYNDGYIGIAKVTKYARRFAGIFKGNYTHCEHFFNAIQRYGEENIETTILHDGLNITEANRLEEEYRPDCNIGWNVRQGGGNSGKQSEETKKKISKNKKGQNRFLYERIFTKEAREKIRISKLGNKNMFGKKHTEETKKKQSESAKQRGIHLNTIRAKYKKVECIETGVIYISQVEAELKTGISHKRISDVCVGRGKTAGGYHWRFSK